MVVVDDVYDVLQVLIGGVLTSTILTLVVVPVLYTVFDDLSKVFKSKNTFSKATHAQGWEHK